jgi:hypothetical protein
LDVPILTVFSRAVSFKEKLASAVFQGCPPRHDYCIPLESIVVSNRSN